MCTLYANIVKMLKNAHHSDMTCIVADGMYLSIFTIHVFTVTL